MKEGLERRTLIRLFLPALFRPLLEHLLIKKLRIMKDVTTTTPLTELTIDELKGCFGGTDDQTDVLAGLLDPAGVIIIEDTYL
jgi:hypothetical protein